MGTRLGFQEAVAVILAAGASTRMGRPKALVRWQGRTFLERVLSSCHRAGVPAAVVLGSDQEAIRSEVNLEGVPTLVNEWPERGPLSSILLALESFESLSALMIHPVDHPFVSWRTVDRLIQEHHRVPASILIPVHEGKKGHPALFPSRFFSDLRRCPLDQGARWVVRQNPSSTTLLPVSDPGILANLNTAADLAHWGL